MSHYSTSGKECQIAAHREGDVYSSSKRGSESVTQDYDVLIKGGQVVTGGGCWPADVCIRAGQIAALATPGGSPRRAQRVIDAGNCLILPGGVDIHTHPVYLDDLHGISITAASGGVTTNGSTMLTPNRA
jgi:dihydroorotase-like cyclic amidohydrolase